MIHKLLGTALVLIIANISIAQNDTTRTTVQIVSTNGKDSVIIDAKGQEWSPIVKKKSKNVHTSWLDHFDIGFSNFNDKTDYLTSSAQQYAPGSNEDWFDIRNGKSINFNLWIYNQRVNLIRHVVNLKYALGLELNNYYYKNPVRYFKDAPYVVLDNSRVYRKTKLAADYVTMPIMLNFALVPRKSNISIAVSRKNKRLYLGNGEIGFSAGISAGYLYSARNKTVTSDEGKQKLKDNFNLNPWKISYVAEINLGYISLYGSYATKSMFKNGLDMTPYTVGLRL